MFSTKQQHGRLFLLLAVPKRYIKTYMARSEGHASGGDFNQNRLHRLLLLIRVLRSGERHTISQLAKRLDTGERSVYRYLRLIEEVGFGVKKDVDGGFYIEAEEVDHVFTSQEAELILQALRIAFPERDEVRAIATKLNVFEPSNELARWIADAGVAQLLGQISEGIATQRRLLLKGYQSANSSTVSNRIVEPMELVGGHRFLAAFEVASRTNKYYRLDRISEVELLDVPVSLSAQHRVHAPDVFGFALDLATASKRIELSMTMQVALFLKAEAPLVTPHLKHEGGRVLLKVVVADHRPAVRFVLPFLNDGGVEVLGDAQFKAEVERAREGFAR